MTSKSRDSLEKSLALISAGTVECPATRVTSPPNIAPAKGSTSEMQALGAAMPARGAAKTVYAYCDCFVAPIILPFSIKRVSVNSVNRPNKG